MTESHPPASPADHDVEFPTTPTGRLVWAWAPAGLMMVAIFAASSLANLTTLPGGMSDHLWHFLAYAVLGALCVRGVALARWQGVTLRSAVWAWCLAAAYGATDEFHQAFVPGRTPAVDDWIADALGSGLAIVVVLLAALGRHVEDRKV